MRPNPKTTYAQIRCAETMRLRRSAQDAEAQVQAAQDAIIAIEAEIRALRADIRAERAALTEFIESPTWERDLLLFARDRVRAELIALSGTRQSCGSCGSFGRGIYDGLLQAEIDALSAAHDPPPDPRAKPMEPIDWPSRLGAVTRRGRALRSDWLHPSRQSAPASIRSHAAYQTGYGVSD